MASAVMASGVVLGADGRPARAWNWHDGQARVMNSTKRFLVLPAGRRYGKTELGVMWIAQRAHRARLAGRRGVIWIVEPTYKVARTPWRKMLRLVPRGWITSMIGTESHPDSVRFGNITVEFRSAEDPEKLVAEGLIALWLDEAGSIQHRVWTEFLRPTLMDFGAPALLTGSPKGRNWFYREHRKGFLPAEFPNYESFGLSPDQGQPSYANPFISAEDVNEIARDLPALLYDQEILARFITSDTGVFRNVRDCTGAPSTDRTVALGVDLAKHSDFTVVIGMDRERRVTLFERRNRISYTLQKEWIKNLYHSLGRPWIVLDATHGSVGDPIADDFRDAGMHVEEFNFTGTSKGPLIEGLMIAFDQQVLTIPDDDVLVGELEDFTVEQTDGGRYRYSAPEGEHDDCVIALALAYRGASRYSDLGFTFGRPAAPA